MTRRYEVLHRTRYGYDEPVSSSYGRAHVRPRDTAGQWCRSTSIDVDPRPDVLSETVDSFGNRTTYFEVHTPHRRLEVTARSEVEVSRTVPDLAQLDEWTWEQARSLLRDGDVAMGWFAGGGDAESERLSAVEFLLASPQVPLGGALEEVFRPVFRSGRPLGETLRDLVHRIHDDFAYTSGATTVSTPLAEVVAARQGVCQDFAHLAAGCLRMAGLPARYVSGYLETQPPPGKPRLQGADASHAWVSVLVPSLGWVDLDPTNDKQVDESFVVTAWGRDYSDVPPMKGVIFTEAKTSTLDVAVDVIRKDLAPSP